MHIFKCLFSTAKELPIQVYRSVFNTTTELILTIQIGSDVNSSCMYSNLDQKQRCLLVIAHY